MPLSMYALWAFVEVQVRVDEAPCSIASGVAEKLAVGGPAGSFTVTITFAVSAPPFPSLAV